MEGAGTRAASSGANLYATEYSSKLLAGSCFGPLPMLRVAWLPHAPLRRLHEKLTVFFLSHWASGHRQARRGLWIAGTRQMARTRCLAKGDQKTLYPAEPAGANGRSCFSCHCGNDPSASHSPSTDEGEAPAGSKPSTPSPGLFGSWAKKRPGGLAGG